MCWNHCVVVLWLQHSGCPTAPQEIPTTQSCTKVSQEVAATQVLACVFERQYPPSCSLQHHCVLINTCETKALGELNEH